MNCRCARGFLERKIATKSDKKKTRTRVITGNVENIVSNNGSRGRVTRGCIVAIRGKGGHAAVGKIKCYGGQKFIGSPG